MTSKYDAYSKSYVKYKHVVTNIDVFWLTLFFTFVFQSHFDTLGGSCGHTCQVISKCNADLELYLKCEHFGTNIDVLCYILFKLVSLLTLLLVSINLLNSVQLSPCFFNNTKIILKTRAFT